MNRRTSLGLFFVLATTALATGCTDTDPTPSENDGVEKDVVENDVADSAPPSDSYSASVAAIGEAVRRRDEARRASAGDQVVAPAVTRFSQRKAQYGLDLDHTFAVRSVRAGENGDRHARLDHFYKGVRVLASTAVVRTARDGTTRGEDVGRVQGGIAIETRPALSAADVVAVASARPERTGRPLIAPRAELVILPVVQRVVKATGAVVTGEEEGLNALDVERRVVEHRLVYRVETLDKGRGAPLASYRYTIDAHTGEVLGTKSLSHSVEGIGKTFKNLGPLGGNLVTLDTTQHGVGPAKSFEPFDSVRNFGVWDDDVCHTCGANADADNTWGDKLAFAGDSTATLVNRQTAIADGLFGMQATWDMCANVYNLTGYNDTFYAGHAFVHSDTDWDDAEYYNLTGNISVGDSGPSNRSSRTTLDTLAHEFGHGINDFWAELGDSDDEGEGLNEANSDILGELADAYSGAGLVNSATTIPLSPGPNWVNIGSGRSFKNPNGPRYWSTGLALLADEHVRAMPMDHAFYFLSQGSNTNPASPEFSTSLPWGMQGIGIEKAGRIWMEALLHRMDGDTDYADARADCLNAAADLFGVGSTEQKAVANAFAAINVGAIAAGYPAGAAAVVESEPNNSSLQSDAATPATPPAGAPVTGSTFKRVIAFGSVTASDVGDFYSVTVPSGKTLRVTLVPANDADLEIFDGFGSSAGSSANGGTAIDQVAVTFPNDGIADPFTIKVKFFATAGSLVPNPPYELYIDIL